jgi:GNAT superfamily N-acetyltransferase
VQRACRNYDRAVASSTDIVASLLDRYGDRKVGIGRDGAAEFPWLFEPYRQADLDLAIELASVRVRDGDLELDLVADVIDRRLGGQAVGAFRRAVRRGSALHHSSLTYEPFQRQGIARRVLSASVFLYDSLGIARVQLNAVGAGRYVWARSGFDFAERVLGGESEPPAVARLRELASRLGHDLGATCCSWEIAGRREEVPPGVFVARGGSLKFLGSPTDCEGPLGRVLFLCAGVGDWDGVLDLRPGSPGRHQFERYCRPKRA